jgi:hypothetical protein
MSTYDVPGAVAAHHDELAMGCWAEHSDGSLIFVESTEAGRVVYSIFDVAQDPPVEYRDAMPEDVFKDRFSWDPDGDDEDEDDENLRWRWHDQTPFDWSRVMRDFPAGARHVSAVEELNAAQRVARSLDLRAEQVRYREPMQTGSGRSIMDRLRAAIGALVE